MQKTKLFMTLFLTLNLTRAIDLIDLTSTQVFPLLGDTAGKTYQFAINNAGDVNKDGKNDIILGGYGNGNSVESAFLIYGTSNLNPVNINFVAPTLNPSSTGIQITKPANNDGFGSQVSSAGDLNGDGFADFMIGAYKNAFQGQVSVLYGGPSLSNTNPNNLNPASTGFRISSTEASSYLGCALSIAGRVNGDSFDDIIIGMSGHNSNRGAALVFYGGLTGSDIQVTGPTAALNPPDTGFSILGNAQNDAFGISVSNVGDINGDKYDDIIVGAAKKAGSKGAAYVIYGSQNPANIDLLSQTLDPATTGFTILGHTGGDFFGGSVSSAGDVNGDKIPDIIIGANEKDSKKGAAYIIYGRKNPANIDLSTETLIPATTGFMVKGGAANGKLGFSVKGVGDLNHDGYSDVMIGEPGQGSVHIIYGGRPETLSNIDISSVVLDPSKNGFTITGSQGFGFSVSSGDLNDDGKTDLFVAASGKLSDSPAGYVIYLSEICADNCDSCSVPSTCDICSTNYEVIQETLKCRECNIIGEYFANHKCHSCIEGCLRCQDGSTCQVCAEDYMMSDWSTCVEKKEDSKTEGSSSAFEAASLVGSSLTSGSSMSLNFGLVAKILRNVKYLNISVAPELRQTFFSWKITSGFLSAPKSWSSSQFDLLPMVFGRYDLEPSFLINYWKIFILTLIGFLIFAIFKLLEGRWKSLRAIHIAASNFALTQFYSNLDDVILYLATDLRSTKFDSLLETLSIMLGVILFIGGIVFLGVHMWLLWKYQSLKQKNMLEGFELKYENINLFFKDFKDLTLFTQSYMVVNMIRCLVSSLVFALLFEYPLLQILLLLTLNILMIIFLLAKRSFKDSLNTYGQLFCEFILLIANICMLVMCFFDVADSKPLDAIEKLSRCVIVLNIMLLLGCVIFLALSVIKMLYTMYQEKKKAKAVEIKKDATFNNKLNGVHFDMTSHKQNNIEEKNENAQIEKWNMTDSNGRVQQNGGWINNQNSSFNNSRQYNNEISHSNMIYGNHVEDFLNTSSVNLVPNASLKASPQRQRSLGKPKRGRIKMPEGTMLKGYLDYQKRQDGRGISYNSGTSRHVDILGPENRKNLERMRFNDMQRNSQIRKTQIEGNIFIEKMREGEW